MSARFGRIPGCKKLISYFDRLLCVIHSRFENSFDKTYGTNTAGRIPLRELTIRSGNTDAGTWYEPCSPRVFRQIMDHLPINFNEFDLIDLGSGKGRALLLASDYGFKRIVGVEFAEELHDASVRNIALWSQRTGRRNVEAICMDATDFAIPDGPLVVFLFSPFRGEVMEHVLANVAASHAMNPREIVIIFWGRNSESIRLLNTIGFHGRELVLRPDWTRFTNYRTLIFTGGSR